MRVYLPKITQVTVIGWRATDQRILELLKAGLPTSVPVYAVAADRREAEDVIKRFGQADIIIQGQVAEFGFSEFVVSRETDD